MKRRDLICGTRRQTTAPDAVEAPRRFHALRVLVAVVAAGSFTGFAQGTAFTYQGRLTDGANPASGSYDLRFALYDAASNGAQPGNALTNTATAVSNGRFTVTLDFGAGIFTGADRWLEIGVRSNGLGDFTRLTPRQPITSTPYAIYAANAGSAATAANVPWSGLGGLPAGFADGVDNNTAYTAGAGLSLSPANQFSLDFGANGTSLSAARSDHDHLGQSWSGAQTRGLLVTTTLAAGVGVAGLLGRQGAGAGSSFVVPAGVWGDSSDGIGALGSTVLVNGAGVQGWHLPTSGSGAGVHGLTASANGRGVRGAAYSASGTNYGVYGETSSPDGYAVYGTSGSGVAIKAAGSGIIQSSARSYFFAPGGGLQRGSTSSLLRVDYASFGARVYSGGFAGDAICALPITVPAAFYGQNVTVKGFTVYYRCENGANNYITATSFHKMVDADTATSLISDTADHTSNTASSYTLVPLGGQELSSAGGGLMLLLTLHFLNDTDYINLGGVRVELGHE